MAECPTLLVAAPASGQGKTLVTAALARRFRSSGRRVRVFKIGPDFLDPTVLERACGYPVYQLDLFMAGEAQCRRLLHEAAQQSDVILIEGAMGLFDGQPSSADLAALFSIPVLAVIDAAAMAQTFGALAYGLSQFRPDLSIAGIFANRIGGIRHAQMLRDALPPALRWAGYLSRRDEIALRERHLGLVQASEVPDLDARIDLAAQAMEWNLEHLQPVQFSDMQAPAVPRLLEAVRIAIARDAAFSFLYAANLELLSTMGARLQFFSPLVDDQLPDCDALWLPGGYPELHLQQLQANAKMKASISNHFAAGRPIVAECGGMLYLAETLTDKAGNRADMVGLLPGHAIMQPRLAALGLQSVEINGLTVRGHTFHHSRFESDIEPTARAQSASGEPGEAVYRMGSLMASYVHLYFSSNPQVVAGLFRP